MTTSPDASLNWVEAAPLDEVWEGEAIDVEIDGKEVLLVRRPGGDVVAFQGICPHQEYSLVEGEIDEDCIVLECPAHHYQFDLRNGKGLNPTNCELYRYETKIEDDVIFVGYPEGDNRHKTCIGVD